MTDGDRAWIALAVGVAAYDAWAGLTGHETMSQSYYRAIRHPFRKWPTIMVWAYITGHLFHIIPTRFDPLRRLDEAFGTGAHR